MTHQCPASRNQRQVMIAAPNINIRNLGYRYLGSENSWTRISEHAIYTNVPPAKLNIIDPTRVGAPLRPSPIAKPPDSKNDNPTILKIMTFFDLVSL